MKHVFVPRVLLYKESVGGNGGEQSKMPDMPSQEYLNNFLKISQQAQEQQKINNLRESGEKAVVALNTILGMGQGGIDRFLTDGKIYKTIADGWMSDQVTPELAQKFKEQIILPVYGRQGWQIKANDVSVGFDPQNIINGYPAIRVNAKGTNSPLMMGIKNGVSSVTIPLPTTFGFNTIPALLPQIQQIPQSNLSFFNQSQQRPGELDITQINNFNNSFGKYGIGMNKQGISHPNGMIMIPPNATNIGTYTNPEFQGNKNAVLSYTLGGMRFDYTVSVMKIGRNESIVVNETNQNGIRNLYTSMR